MEKTSKVIEIAENKGNFSTQKGTFYKHEITFENGDKGFYNSSSTACTKFIKGEITTYDIESKVNGSYTNIIIKPIQKDNGFTGAKKPLNEKSIIAQTAYRGACDLNAQAMEPSIEKTLKDAEVAYKWILNKSGITE